MNKDTRVLIDACALVNVGVCDLLLRLAEDPPQYVPLWSELVLDEVRKVHVEVFGRAEERADHWRHEVSKAFPEASVEDYESLMEGLTNHEDDRHVLAAAIKGRAEIIVTFNLRDFPTQSVEPWRMKVQHPQVFLLEAYSESSSIVLLRLNEMAADRRVELQDLLIRMGKTLPLFSSRVLADLPDPTP